jgi:hypothetical protein
MQLLLESRWKNQLVSGAAAGQILVEMHRNDIPDLNAMLVHADIPVMALQSVNALEAYFLSLTGSNQHVDTFTN